MSDIESSAEQTLGNTDSKPLGPATVLAAAVTKEKAREGADLELVQLLESTVLRVDATDGAWAKAAAAIGELALARAQSRMEKS
jgi:hypothetical protein